MWRGRRREQAEGWGAPALMSVRGAGCARRKPKEVCAVQACARRAGGAVTGQRSTVIGQRSLVNGHWSTVISHWSLIIGRALVIGQRSFTDH